MYINRASCIGCSKALAAAGVAVVVHRVGENDMHRNPDETEDFLRKCGVEVKRWEDNATG